LFDTLFDTDTIANSTVDKSFVLGINIMERSQ